MRLAKHFPRYIFETIELGPKFDRETDTTDDVIRYTDYDFTGSKIDRK